MPRAVAGPLRTAWARKSHPRASLSQRAPPALDERRAQLKETPTCWARCVDSSSLAIIPDGYATNRVSDAARAKKQHCACSGRGGGNPSVATAWVRPRRRRASGGGAAPVNTTDTRALRLCPAVTQRLRCGRAPSSCGDIVAGPLTKKEGAPSEKAGPRLLRDSGSVIRNSFRLADRR